MYNQVATYVSLKEHERKQTELVKDAEILRALAASNARPIGPVRRIAGARAWLARVASCLGSRPAYAPGYRRELESSGST